MSEVSQSPPHMEHGAFFSYLLDRGLIGLAWASDELVIVKTMGKLADWITLGDRTTEDLAPFVGLEDDLNELMDDFRPSLVLSNVGMNAETGDNAKISIEVFWHEAEQHFVIVLHRLGGQPEFEEDMARQLRGRRLAEENIAAMQRQIQQTQGLLDVIATYAPVGIAVQDLERNYSFVTKRWLEQLRTTSGGPFLPEDAPFAVGVGDALRGRESSGWPNMDLGESEVAASASVDGLAWRHSPWHDAAGNVAGVVSAVHPVPELSQECTRLRTRVHELERAKSDLEAFAVMLAHDIRAPLSALRSRLLQEREHKTVDDAVSEIDTTLERVRQIADGLLEFASASNTKGTESAVDLGSMVKRIAEECTADSDLRFELRGDWPITELAVAPLDIILRNLVQNAVRHHDRGHGLISISIARTDSRLVIEVADDGPGIPPEHHDAIFHPLQKVGGAECGSTGLGLAFVRRAASSVDAKIELESEPDRRRGTTFRILWPGA